MKLYQAIATRIGAIENCKRSGNTEWQEKHAESIRGMVSMYMPHGSGFDGGSSLDMDKSTPEKLVINTGFHHMDENGGYNGWTDHAVIVRPSLQHRFTLSVTGHNRNGIKEYIEEVFRVALETEIDPK